MNEDHLLVAAAVQRYLITHPSPEGMVTTVELRTIGDHLTAEGIQLPPRGLRDYLSVVCREHLTGVVVYRQSNGSTMLTAAKALVEGRFLNFVFHL